jgi:hypothetical protein
MAELATIITNIAIKWGAGKKSVKLTELIDFMPKWDQEKKKEIPKQSIEDMKKALKEIYESQKKQKRTDDKRPPTNLKTKQNG